MRSNGVVFGTLIILLAGWTSWFGLYLQSRVVKFVPSGEASFFLICQLTYPSLSVVFDLAIAINCIGTGISYMILMGNLTSQILTSFDVGIIFLQNSVFWITFYTCFILAPLCYLRNLDSLRYSSSVALIAILYLVIIVISHFLIGDTNNGPNPIRYFEVESIKMTLSTFPIVVFAYTGQQNMFSIINELRDKTTNNIHRITQTSIGLSSALYLTVGILGYLSFGDNVGDNIVSMYEHSVSTTIGRCAIILLVLLSFPIQLHPSRISVNNILYWIELKMKKHNSDEITPLLGPPELIVAPLDNKRFIILTTILLAGSYLVAISVNSLQLVLSIIGATGSTAISFILPGLFGYKLLGGEGNVNGGKVPLRQSIIKYLSLLLTIWGVLVGSLCLYVITLS